MKQILIGVALGALLTVNFPIVGNALIPLSELEKQSATGAEKAGQPTQVSQDSDVGFSRYRMEEESNRLVLALSVMGAGLLSLFLVLAYLKSREAAPETVVTGSGLVLVIFATVLVVILAKVDQQLTAATGILGAIAGYLFGKATKGPDAEQKPGKAVTP
jgi:Na+-transporting methylmalonyl-CoA/oxaloacetate decarboxylase beta subunit